MISLLIILLVGFIALFSGGFKEKKRLPYGYYRDDYEPFDSYYNLPPRHFYDPYYAQRYGRSGHNAGEGCLMVVLMIVGVVGMLIYLGGG
jgi:hypothetical protein